MWMGLFCYGQKRGAQLFADMRGQAIEVFYPSVFKGAKPDDFILDLNKPDLIVLENNSPEKRLVLFKGMEVWQIR